MRSIFRPVIHFVNENLQLQLLSRSQTPSDFPICQVHPPNPDTRDLHQITSGDTPSSYIDDIDPIEQARSKPNVLSDHLRP